MLIDPPGGWPLLENETFQYQCFEDMYFTSDDTTTFIDIACGPNNTFFWPSEVPNCQRLQCRDAPATNLLMTLIDYNNNGTYYAGDPPIQ